MNRCLTHDGKGTVAILLAGLAFQVLGGEVRFAENTEPFANPAQGWTAYGNWDKVTNYVNVGCGYFRFQWQELNPKEDVYDWTPLEREIDFYAKRGLPFYFRLMTCSRNGKRKSLVPDWVWAKGAKPHPYQGAKFNYDQEGDKNATTEMWCPYWDDEVFLSAHEKFLKALAAKYDGDPRLYAVDIGSYGNWGEWHCWRLGKDGVSDRDYGADNATKWRIAKMYLDNFTRTPLVMMTDDIPTLRRMFAGGMRPAGLRRDGVGLIKLFKRWGKDGSRYETVDGMDEVWRSKPVAFEWVSPLERLMKPGQKAFDRGQDMSDIDFACEWMLARHVSTIDTVPFFPWQLDDYPEKKSATRKLDLYAGARLVPRTAAVTSDGRTVEIVLRGENKGVAPIYAPFRLALCVKDAGWSKDFDVDLAKALPGPFEFRGRFADVPEGARSLRIRHAAGLWRDFRFAAQNLNEDGSLPL